MAQIYVIATPIGNELDLSPRAIEVLKTVDRIAAEDTRAFLQLVQKLKIKTAQIVSYHDHNEKESSDQLIQDVLKGGTLALVSDAGTPQISDPGYQLLKKAFEHNISVTTLPGPSALTATLSVCPIGGKSLYFGGFAPADETKLLEELKTSALKADRIVYFESPHRIQKHLEIAHQVWKTEKVFISREISKTYEEFLYKPLQDLKSYFQSPKGEFVVVYPGIESFELSLEDLRLRIQALVEHNLKPSDILEQVRAVTSLPRRQLYDLITEIKHRLKNE